MFTAELSFHAFLAHFLPLGCGLSSVQDDDRFMQCLPTLLRTDERERGIRRNMEMTHKFSTPNLELVL